MNKSAITDRHESFCEQYVIDFNATQAVIRSGFVSNSATSNSAGVLGSKLLSNANIRGRIGELVANKSHKMGIDSQWVLAEAINVYKNCTNGKSRYDAGNALKALVIIGKHINVQAFTENNEHSDSNVDSVIMWGSIKKPQQLSGPPNLFLKAANLVSKSLVPA